MKITSHKVNQSQCSSQLGSKINSNCLKNCCCFSYLVTFDDLRIVTDLINNDLILQDDAITTRDRLHTVLRIGVKHNHLEHVLQTIVARLAQVIVGKVLEHDSATT